MDHGLRRRQSYLCDWGTAASHILPSPSQSYFTWWWRLEIEWTVNFQKNQLQGQSAWLWRSGSAAV